MRLTAIFCVSAALGFGADFRQADWGMTKEQVISAEGRPAEETSDMLTYKTDVLGRKAILAFHFVGGKLGQAGYQLDEHFSEAGLYVTTAGKWVQPLKVKYGEPKTTLQWLNDLYREDQRKWPLAISAGHMSIDNDWQTERTAIRHSISGKNFQISVQIVYTSREMLPLLQQKLAEDQKNIF